MVLNVPIFASTTARAEAPKPFPPEIATVALVYSEPRFVIVIF